MRRLCVGVGVAVYPAAASNLARLSTGLSKANTSKMAGDTVSR